MLTEEQRKERKTGIGGSDVAAILGISRFKTAFDVWLRLTGREEEQENKIDFKKLYLYLGNKDEATVAELYEIATGKKLRKINKTLRDNKQPWLIGNIDRKIIGEDKILECKTAHEYAEGWGKSGTDHIPDEYIVQVQHYLALTGYKEADLAALFGRRDFRIYHLKKDDSVIDWMHEKVNYFWHEHVLTDMPPEPVTYKDSLKQWPEDKGNYLEAKDEQIELIKKYKELTRLTEKTKVDIIKEIGEAPGIICNKKKLVTWKTNKNGSRIFRLYGE